MEAEGFEVSGKLDFSYNLDANMKISLQKMNEKTKKRKEDLAKVGNEKNEDAFNKMKQMMLAKEEAKNGGVFEYKPKESAQKNLDEEYDIEINEGEDDEEVIKSDLDDEEDDDTPLEYSAENLEDFMNSLRNQQQANTSRVGPEMLASTGKSDKIITDFLHNVKTRDPAKTG